ncbi:MAG: c-type cytochrome [Anaerolineaceae bacterium]|nr:c-type cytochrome [Anaerolineaceae bacterium]
MKKAYYVFFAFIFLGFLSGCSVSLAADVTPPPNLVQQDPSPMSPTSAPSIVLPMMEPDIFNGAIIYEQKCVPCHGETGMGDGAQSNQLPNPVTPVGDIRIARDAKPIDWYKVITIGNFERFMPGFQSLSDRERWDVTAYALTLSLSEDMIKNGEVIFSENCVECHTKENLPLQSASAMAEKSLSDILLVITTGIDTEMHSFSDLLSDEDQLAVASYVRYLGFTENNEVVEESGSENSNEIEPKEEDAASIEQTKFSIVGELVNVETVPEDLFVTLSGYDGMDMVFQVESPVAGDGSFKFDELENVSGRIYQASLVIDGIQHTSDVLHDPVTDDQGNVNLPIVIKKTSVDSSALYAERMHVFFDFIAENTIQIVEMYVIQNPTDTVIVPLDNKTPVVRFIIPEGAQNLQFEGGLLGREFIQLENGFGSMQSYGANSSVQILFAYELPYEKSLDLDIQLPLLVNASIFMLPSDTVKFSSDQLVFSGERDIQGMKIQTYSGGVMDAESSIKMSLSGKVKDNVSIVQGGNTTSLVVGGSVLLITIFGAVFYLRKKMKTSEVINEIESGEEDLESLLDAVIALDDAFQSGEIPESAYYNRRNELTKLIKMKQNSEA